jgi:hypothetical protein
MINLNLNRRIRQTLYVLKRAFGNMVTIYRFLESDTDYKTGIKTNVTESYVVRKCIILPLKITREVIQTISEISANKNFVYGGSYDSDLRDVVIDARDLPTGYSPRQNDYIVYNDQRYELKNIAELEQKTGWLISGKAVIGPAIIRVSLIDNLTTEEDMFKGSNASITQSLVLNQLTTGPINRVGNVSEGMTLDQSMTGPVNRAGNASDSMTVGETTGGTV